MNLPKINFSTLPDWAKVIVYIVLALSAVIGSMFALSSCTVSHVVSQSSTTTTTKSDGTTESIATTITYDQSGKGSK